MLPTALRWPLFGALTMGAVATSQPPLALRAVHAEQFAATGSLVNAAADVDGDGDLDLFVGFNGTPNRLYRNDGARFTEIGAAAGIADARATRAAAFGDWDGDGDPDLLVGFAPGGGSVLRLYRNEGGRFTDVTASAGVALDSGAVRQPVWVDMDSDGDLDLFVAFRDRPNALFRNDGGRFTDIAPQIGLADPRRSVGAVWADLDADGDLDVLVGNMDGDANGVFRNEQGHFTDVAEAWGLAWGGRAPREATNGTVRPCVADVNGDGRLDIITANYGPPGLFLADGTGWRDAGASWGVAVDGRYDSCALADVDHDGRLDLYLNGTVTQGRNWPDYLYRQQNGRFVNAIPTDVAAVAADHGVQWHDFDGDGAADLALTGQGPHAMFANALPAAVARRSLRVRVFDARGRATRAGAEVRVYAAGTRTLLGTALVDAGSGYDAQSDAPVHIGLARNGRVDVEVTWPANGVRQVTYARGIAVDGRRVLEVRTAATPATGESAQPPVRELQAVLRRPAVQRALADLDRAAPQMAAGLAALGAIESPSGKEHERAAEVARRLRAMGMPEVHLDSVPNVIARIPGTSGRAVVFVSTLDDLASIPALQRAAGSPPRVEGDRVVGPGTNTSATTEAMLAAAQAVLASGHRPQHDLVFAAVAQEETGLLGMKALYAQYRDRAVAFVDILGDGRSITYGALGIHWWRVVAQGPSGHSLGGGVPNVNQAIGRAVDRILSLPQPAATDNPQRTILNIAMLQSGAVFNHKPDSGWFSLDIRSLDAETIARNEAAVQRILDDVARETGLSLTMHQVSRTPGGQIAGADTSLLVRASSAIAQSLGLTPRLGNAGSANLNVAIGGGTLAIGLGGERGGFRGQPAEFADIPAMVRTAKHVLLLSLVMSGTR